MNRRNFIKNSSYLSALLGASMTSYAERFQNKSHYKHFVFLNLVGGPSQFETFDPKPNTEFGGPTKAIKTRTKGLTFSNSLPKLAELSDNISTLRMTSKEGNHQRAQYNLQSGGYIPLGALKHASITSIAGRALHSPSNLMPGSVCIGKGCESSGYLGKEFAPLTIPRAEDGSKNIIAATNYQKHISKAMNIRNFYAEKVSPKKYMDQFSEEVKLQQRSTKFSTPNHAKIFDIQTESDQTKERYGLSDAGSSLLLAKKLIHAGVSAIQVNHYNWDTHINNFGGSQNLCREIDNGLSALIQDLKAMDKYDETLILVAGEFGRTPRINGNDGRDHYAHSWSALLCSGSLKSSVIGETSPDGVKVKSGITVPQLSYSIYELLGANPNEWFDTSIGRPIKISPGKSGIPQLKA
ncbi:MAG: DUF1501 domain-containing protein [Lentisphaeraceae bacterium]|nr:DUF1501 domain-containing protein [Lentisphaeraceae bacterium]